MNTVSHYPQIIGHHAGTIIITFIILSLIKGAYITFAGTTTNYNIQNKWLCVKM